MNCLLQHAKLSFLNRANAILSIPLLYIIFLLFSTNGDNPNTSSFAGALGTVGVLGLFLSMLIAGSQFTVLSIPSLYAIPVQRRYALRVVAYGGVINLLLAIIFFMDNEAIRLYFTTLLFPYVLLFSLASYLLGTVSILFFRGFYLPLLMIVPVFLIPEFSFIGMPEIISQHLGLTYSLTLISLLILLSSIKKLSSPRRLSEKQFIGLFPVSKSYRKKEQRKAALQIGSSSNSDDMLFRLLSKGLYKSKPGSIRHCVYSHLYRNTRPDYKEILLALLFLVILIIGYTSFKSETGLRIQAIALAASLLTSVAIPSLLPLRPLDSMLLPHSRQTQIRTALIIAFLSCLIAVLTNYIFVIGAVFLKSILPINFQYLIISIKRCYLPLLLTPVIQAAPLGRARTRRNRLWLYWMLPFCMLLVIVLTASLAFAALINWCLLALAITSYFQNRDTSTT